jgi:hypothetical protein
MHERTPASALTKVNTVSITFVRLLSNNQVYTSLPAKSRGKVSLLTNKWEKFIPVTFPILFLKKEYKVIPDSYEDALN